MLQVYSYENFMLELQIFKLVGYIFRDFYFMNFKGGGLFLFFSRAETAIPYRQKKVEGLVSEE